MSGVFENQDAAVVQMDFRGFPRLSLVVPVWVRLMGIPGTVEPVEIRFVVGDPFLDRLPRRFDGFHRLDVKRRRWRARKLDDAFPQTMEAEEKFDLLGAFDGADEFHGSFAAGALEWIGSPVLRQGYGGQAGLERSGTQKSLTRKGFSGCCLEIALEIGSRAFGFESTIPRQSPRYASFGRNVPTLIVDSQALFQIR